VVLLNPIRSVVPGSVRHTVVNSLRQHGRLIPIKRVLPLARPGRCL